MHKYLVELLGIEGFLEIVADSEREVIELNRIVTGRLVCKIQEVESF